jgi:FKBP-type peptidyl-prolyl cis-trans isomerase FklB
MAQNSKKQPAAKTKSGKAVELKPTELSKTDKFSYAVGYNIATGMKMQNIEVNPDVLAAAMKAVINGTPGLMTEEEVMNTLRNFEAEMQQKMQAEQGQGGGANSEQAAQNKAAGAAFLAENGKRAGVVTLPSGLQYEIMKAGTGAKPGPTDKVTTHYHGTLIDGTVFDSSVDRGQPASFPVNGVIKGWVEALQLMPTGSKWKLYIPSDLAYGDFGSPPKIQPGATLVFEVELLSIDK